MSVTLLVVLTVLTAARLTRLVVADSFPPLAVARMRVVERWGQESWQAYLVHCPWCMGVWLAAAVVAAVTAWYGLPAPVLVWAAAAWGSGFLAAIEPQGDSG
jgi:hypothetical protein